MIEKLLQKREVTFSDDVLAFVYVVFAYKLPNNNGFSIGNISTM